MRATEFIVEEVNPDCFNPAFNDTQIFDGLTYRATSDEEKNGMKFFQIKVFDDNFEKVGITKFKAHKDANGNSWLESLITAIHPAYQGKGIARNIYAYARMLGNTIKPSGDQSDQGRAMWNAWQQSGDAEHLMREEIIDEMPLPADWDASQYDPGTTFKARLAYALERAKKLGTGSSRVATTIEYEGRPTVLKIAKNQKGLAQNSVEADILSDGYASQLGILIPIIDYDEKNREPTWVHTELAQKANDKKLANLMGEDSLNDIIQLAMAIAGKSRFFTYQGLTDSMRKRGKTEDQINTATDYANTLADLVSSFDVELGDLGRAANWGLYKGKPVIIDIGFNTNVLNQYYKR